MSESEELKKKKLKPKLSYLPETIFLGPMFSRLQKLTKNYYAEPKIRKSNLEPEFKIIFEILAHHLDDAAKIMEQGVVKYSLDGWKQVDIAEFYEAMLRHEKLYVAGKTLDKESGLPHRAHVLCNLLIIYAKS